MLCLQRVEGFRCPDFPPLFLVINTFNLTHIRFYQSENLKYAYQKLSIILSRHFGMEKDTKFENITPSYALIFEHNLGYSTL